MNNSGLIESGPFKHLNISSDKEPLLRDSSRKSTLHEDYQQNNNSEAMNWINLDVNSENSGMSLSKNSAKKEKPYLENIAPEVTQSHPITLDVQETPNPNIQQQETIQATQKPVEIREEESERLLDKVQNQFECDKSTSSVANSMASRKPNKFSHRLDELKRQQAKLDKIKSEKGQLESFLQYQAEMEREKERKRQEELQKVEIIYNQNAVILQKYARVWLAKRYVAELQEQEFRRQKELLNNALAEMRDQIRVVGTDSKERFVNGAIVIQKYARGMFIRKLLAPYFELYRSVNPLVHILDKTNHNLA